MFKFCLGHSAIDSLTSHLHEVPINYFSLTYLFIELLIIMTNGSKQKGRVTQSNPGPSRVPEELDPTPASSRTTHELPSGPTSEPTTSNLEPSESVREDERRIALEKLNSFVSEYRNRKTSKSKALFNILSFLDGEPTITESEKEKAVDLYVEEINSINHDGRTGDTNVRPGFRAASAPNAALKSLELLFLRKL